MAATTVSASNTRGAALVAELEGFVDEHEAWRGRCLNMDAAESASSIRSTRVLSSDLAQRACAGTVRMRNHRGTRYIDAIEESAIGIMKDLFRAEYAEVQIATGSVANAVALRLLTDVGDVILRSQRPRAHPTVDVHGYAGFRGLEIHDIDLHPENFTVDLDQFEAQVKSLRPKLVCLGSAVMLFPYPLQEMADIAHAAGAAVMYDGAHVMGLIANRRFQDPLSEGADVLTGTGYKSFSGPLGGLLFHNSAEYDEFIRPALAGSGYVGTYNHARVLAMAITAAEHLEFGEQLASQMVANARCLGAELDRLGFKVVGGELGYTESSQIFLDVTAHGTGNEISARLEEANIITMGMQLWDEASRNGLRVATHEMTRLGMCEPEMRSIAELFRRLVLEGEAPESVLPDVIELRSAFTDVRYSFDECA